MTYSLVSHVVRRGVEEVHSHYAARQLYVEQLEQDAQLYENADVPEMKPYELLPVLITGLIAVFTIWTVSADVTWQKASPGPRLTCVCVALRR